MGRRTAATISKYTQEIIRRQKREVISRASSVTISLDDKGEHRLIKYKTNLDENLGRGILGVLRFSGRSSCSTLEDLDEDYSQRMADTVVDAAKRLCTPMEENLDIHLFAHFKSIVRIFTADGASSVQKCGRILANTFTNITLILRDPCHSIRTGTTMFF